MLKTALTNSFIYKTLMLIMNYYNNSKTKAAFDKLSHIASESSVYKRYYKFTHRHPFVRYSLYQAALDKISAVISRIMKPLNELLNKLTGGSNLKTIYLSFLNNKPENKLRAVGLFGFYFCVSYTFISIIVGSAAPGNGFELSARATVVFLAGMVFFALAFFAGRLAMIFKNSFFVKLLMDLLK